jgi:putative transposase
MPRRPRIHLPGLPLHVVQRGHNRDACFFAEEDHLVYREWLGEACKATGCALHAYVQMTNHVHLLLSPPEPEAVSRLMISLGRRYVQYINKTYHRTGTLWDSRYKSSLVQADAYLLLCQRYIELNPVRATMVDDPAHYRWSSYRANGLGQPDSLLTPHVVYSSLGTNEADRLANYRSLFARNWIPTQSATSAWPWIRGSRSGMRGSSTVSNGPLDSGEKFARAVGRGRQCLRKRGHRTRCHLMCEPGPFFFIFPSSNQVLPQTNFLRGVVQGWLGKITPIPGFPGRVRCRVRVTHGSSFAVHVRPFALPFGAATMASADS